jgi:hypothetical protein
MTQETLTNGLPRRQPGCRSGMTNAGWAYDSHPELEELTAGKTLVLADIEGPGVVTAIHMLQHIARLEFSHAFIDRGEIVDPSLEKETLRCSARGLILEVFYDDAPLPAVRCPLADFYADGCGGKSIYYSTLFVEKLAESYNAYFAMPFRKRIRITLRNETPFDLLHYTTVEYQRLPAWDDSLMYFHCTWRKQAFQLTPDTIQPIITIPGEGQYIGNQLSIYTREPAFKGFFFIMEGNCEYRLDGEARPTFDYLGTEDSYTYSWGFRQATTGLRCGINYLQQDEAPYELSIFRFRDRNAILFSRSLDLTINWAHEFTWGMKDYQTRPRRLIWSAVERGDCRVEYATTHYWYQAAAGFDHGDLLPYEKRLAPLF